MRKMPAERTPQWEPTTCCERMLFGIVMPGGKLFAHAARNGAKWKCPVCGKLWQHKCASPCSWEEIV